jgi:hypothetical protein
VQRLLHLVELEGLNDRLNLFHMFPCRSVPLSRSPAWRIICGRKESLDMPKELATLRRAVQQDS